MTDHDASGDDGRTRRRRRGRRAAPLTLERDFWERGLEYVAGLDEVGIGPLAGPVVAAAVVLRPNRHIKGATDSKRVPAPERERLAAEIRRRALCVGVGAASPREIDRINILRASHLAMRRALRQLRVRPQHLIIDGNSTPRLGAEATAVVGGDRKCHSVACASIVAKVVRDELMRRLGGRYPGYGWERNAGYSTPEHLDAVDRLGLTPHHRRSFRQQLVMEL